MEESNRLTAPTVKAMKEKIITVSPEKCVGCGICEYACSYRKEGVFNPLKSRIRVIRIGLLINTALVCRKCEDPSCVRSCPRGALVKRRWDGLVIVNEEKCDGCGYCIEACDFGAITIHPEKNVAIICDYCAGEPECMLWCPEEAIQLVPKENLAQEKRVGAVKRRFEKELEVTA